MGTSPLLNTQCPSFAPFQHSLVSPLFQFAYSGSGVALFTLFVYSVCLLRFRYSEWGLIRPRTEVRRQSHANSEWSQSSDCNSEWVGVLTVTPNGSEFGLQTSNLKLRIGSEFELCLLVGPVCKQIL
jgi:hypothetical protein